MDDYFEWDLAKEDQNILKHNLSFKKAKKAFYDNKRVILEDLSHSTLEQRYFCLGRVGKFVITVRFTYRNNKIRIFGAGYWRKGKKYYEKYNKIYK